MRTRMFDSGCGVQVEVEVKQVANSWCESMAGKWDDLRLEPSHLPSGHTKVVDCMSEWQDGGHGCDEVRGGG